MYHRWCLLEQMESLQEEIDGLRKSSAETSAQLAKTTSELTEKDEDVKSMQADSKRQLIEVYEMKCVQILFVLHSNADACVFISHAEQYQTKKRKSNY